MESPIAVANFFISKSFDTGIEVTPMKVLKLVYISHGWNLGLTSEPLINEAIQAWKYGPVIESVYTEFKEYRNAKITALGSIFSMDNNDFRVMTPQVSGHIDLLEKIWEVYKDYSGLQLSTLTHQQGTPWDIVWNQNGGSKTMGAIISNDIIEQHYKTKISNVA